MGTILDNLKSLFGKSRATSAQDRDKALSGFLLRYQSFRELLRANATLASQLAKLEAASRGDQNMDVEQVRVETRRATAACKTMAQSLNQLSRDRYTELSAPLSHITEKIEEELTQHAAGDVHQLTISLTEVDATMAYSVGAKNANLGELANMLELPVPAGFAITIRAGQLFLAQKGLFDKVRFELSRIDSDIPATIQKASEEITTAILESPLPERVEHELLSAFDAAFGKDKSTLVALRSSAISEDGLQSFAGQYLSVLGVTRDTLLQAWRRVFASLYSPRALTYRLRNGYELGSTGMGMVCLKMIEAKAAGVAFSRHPVNLRSNDVLINGVWGLGEAVADGSASPDEWLVSRATNKVTRETVAKKLTRIDLVKTDKGIETEAVEVNDLLQDVPCLTQTQVRQVAEWALKIEHHYQYPQDVEWAIDQDEQLMLLQARPMGFDADQGEIRPPEVTRVKPILRNAEVAAKGVGCGKVMILDPDADMTHFPEGYVMVIPHSSPNATFAMQRACAIIAETGSLTGHMASVSREYGVPTIMNVPGATTLLQDGQLVTVDALKGRVFPGEIQELLDLRISRRPPVADTPALALLRRVSGLVLPLHLVDPRSPLFKPENCTSIHDIMRFIHEKSYSEMFKISDALSEQSDTAATHFKGAIPLDLYMIDLGGGLKDPLVRSAGVEEVTSAPFRTILEGMLNPAVQARGPRPINMHGFMSVMGNSMLSGNKAGGDRFGDHSYAIISDRYVNFSSRVGYHYAVLDSWCGDTQSKNYIRFEFAGGAAGSVQRGRRVRCIGIILSSLGFRVNVLGDHIRANYQKYSRQDTLNRLDQMGRLLIMTRQMDMLMTSEEAVQAFANNFLNGDYH